MSLAQQAHFFFLENFKSLRSIFAPLFEIKILLHFEIERARKNCSKDYLMALKYE
jgi:hypothetical protein